MFERGGPTFFELARQALSSTDRGYDLIAPKFDRTPFRTPDEFVEEALACPSMRATFGSALDVACGTGAGLLALTKRCPRVVGVDRSRGMLEVARRAAPAAQLVLADALALPFGAAFDVVTMFGAHGHIEERDEPAFVRAMAAALTPGGRFVCITAPPPRPLSRVSIMARSFNAAMRVRNALISPPFIMYYLTFLLPRARALLEDAGLRVDVHPLSRAPYVVVVAHKPDRS